MTIPLTLLFLISAGEILLLVVVTSFFMRLKRSEKALNTLQEKQEVLLTKLRFNTELEQELVSTFESRQAELAQLDQGLAQRAEELGKLLDKAERACRSPRLMREIIIEGHRHGKSAQALALNTGLSVDEVELILDQASS